MRTEILGIGFDGYTLGQTVEWALDTMKEKRAAYVCTPNPEIVWACQKDPEMAAAVNGADAVLPDGVGVVWASRYLKTPVPERVAGYDFLLALLERMEGTVFLLGGRPGVAEEAAENIRLRFPGVTVAGCCHGYYEDDSEVLAAIRAAEPDLLLVCLGARRQEKWMAAQAGKLPVGLMAGLGGSLDVLAGRVRRAPEGWRNRGLEWLYRLLREPSRIKRQIWLPRFVLAVMMQRIRK